METLEDSHWDVLIGGTGLHQSLLALALSRSDKKILHVDENGFYGGAEAAFSTQEAEDWARRVEDEQTPAALQPALFSSAQVWKPTGEAAGDDAPKLSFPRAYSLTLSPQLIYSLSDILPALVSSKVYKQLEFLAMGSWWVFSKSPAEQQEESSASQENPAAAAAPRGMLTKVPGSREDIFADSTLQPRAKRALMKFLRFLVNYEEEELWETNRQRPFLEFLSEAFNIPPEVFDATFALTLSPKNPKTTTTEYALPRIARHLRSIGIFGPGFGSVLPKWGGLSELTQVACRAGAVGGGVYVLGKGLGGVVESESQDASVTEPKEETKEETKEEPETKGIRLRLSGGESVTSTWVVGSVDDLAPVTAALPKPDHTERTTETVSRSITIVSSSLEPLYPPPAEGAPPPAGAVVTFPSGSLDSRPTEALDESAHPPVIIFVHSNDTGECPTGQSILYASVAVPGERGFSLLEAAIRSLLECIRVQPSPTVLWSMRYEQRSDPMTSPTATEGRSASENILAFPRPSLDLAFDNDVLDRVREVWQKIMGEDSGQFLVFEDREGMNDEGDD